MDRDQKGMVESVLDSFKRDAKLYEEVRAKLPRIEEDFDRQFDRFRRVEAPRGFAAAPDALALSARRIAESIARSRFRPVLVIRDNRVVPEFVGPDSEVWKERILERQSVLDGVIPSIGRVEVHGNIAYQWAGTGWLIDSDIIVTNRHVASIFAKNRTGFAFKMGYPSGTQSARLDFLEEDQRSMALEFPIDSVLWMSEDRDDEPDVAFLRIRRSPSGPNLPRPLPLADSAGAGDVVVAIGYPARDPDVPDQELVLRTFGEVYDKKRLAPGEVEEVNDMELSHDCSTLGGNSGSAVVQLSSGRVVGLHFAGLYMEANYAVTSKKLNELLMKLRRGELPRMRPIEVPSTSPAALAPTALSATPHGTFTIEASIPIRVTLEIGGATVAGAATPLAPVHAPPAAGELNYEAALEAARTALRDVPNVLSVRLGYRFRRGWITDERVIAVEVKAKKDLPGLREAGLPMIPSEFLGVGVDVRTAALAEQLEPFGVQLELEAPTRPGVYREPPHLSLERVRERMRAIFHVSPDSGFPNLRNFIERIEQHLTATMYEWDTNHISRALATRLRQNERTLKMVTERKGTRDAVEALDRRLRRLEHVYASTGAGKIVPRAYHIKVASRDRAEFWLSSGNWKDSNQADIDPAGENATSISPLRQHNREWHAIITNQKLAGIFQDYIEWDFDEAHRVPLEEAPGAVLPDIFVPEAVFDDRLERRVAVEYFDPLPIDRDLDVQPLLTPDRNATSGNRMFMETLTQLLESAGSVIHVQNQSFNLLDDNEAQFERFFEILKEKQDDDLDVKIIFRDAREFGSGSGVSQQRLLERIKDFGIDTDLIRLQRRCHTKGVIIDPDSDENAAVILGSHNLTNAGALFNRDASLLIRDAEVAKYFDRIFNFDWEVLATQEADETIGGVRVALPHEATPPGFRRVSLAEFLGES